jgi:hypothetical protein
MRVCHSIFYKLILLCLVCIAPVAQGQSIDITKQNEAWLLTASQAKLTVILNKIENVTGVVIHSTELSSQLLDRHCVSAKVVELVNCVFAQQTNSVFRYSPDKQNKLAELWILPMEEPPVNFSQVIKPARPAQPVMAKQADNTVQLLDLMQSTNATKRAETAAQLANLDKRHDNDIHNALMAALSDKDGDVRAQAVAALAKREGEGASGILKSALLDGEVSVRLMAVDSAGNNIELLQQGSLDEDATVRMYALTKLKALGIN